MTDIFQEIERLRIENDKLQRALDKLVFELAPDAAAKIEQQKSEIERLRLNQHTNRYRAAVDNLNRVTDRDLQENAPMTDLVERLRTWADIHRHGAIPADHLVEAADEIERLREALDTCRKLRSLVNGDLVVARAEIGRLRQRGGNS